MFLIEWLGESGLTFILHLTTAAYKVPTEMLHFQILHMAHWVQLCWALSKYLLLWYINAEWDIKVKYVRSD